MVYVRYFRSGVEFKGEEVLKKDLRRTDGRSVRRKYCTLGLRNDQAAEAAALPPVIAGKNETAPRSLISERTRWHAREIRGALMLPLITNVFHERNRKIVSAAWRK